MVSAPAAEPPLEVVETELSRVYLTPTDAWKLKKSVALGPVDYTTPEKRRRACEAEVRLNRHLAPGVYRGVAPVVAGGGRWRIGGPGEPTDWVVHMRRLADGHRADRRLVTGRLTDAHIRAIAKRLAAFHRDARCDQETRKQGAPGALARLVRAPLGSDTASGELPAVPEAAVAEAWQRGFLEEHAALFEARGEAGRVRDGHGDLRLEHCFVDEAGTVEILDRLEFSETLRFMDVCADVAFLSTDLASRRRVDLAERLVANYAEAADDFDLYPLLDFYASCRASLRGWLELFFAGRERGGRLSERRMARARGYFLMALAARRRPLLPPTVVTLGGTVASGKSTLAQGIAAKIGAPVVCADRARVFLLGGRASGAKHEVHWERAYEAGFTYRVYVELMRRAGAVLRSGRPVVIDACFPSKRLRDVARRMAARHGHPFLFVEASVGPGPQRERLCERARRDGVEPAVWLDIASELSAQWEKPDEISASQRLRLDCGRPLDQNLAELRACLTTWPEGLTG